MIKKVMNKKKKFKNVEQEYFNFSCSSFFTKPEKYGIKTIDIAPKAIRLKIISGNLKAAE